MLTRPSALAALSSLLFCETGSLALFLGGLIARGIKWGSQVTKCISFGFLHSTPSEEADLVKQYGLQGADSYEMLGYDDNGEEDDDDKEDTNLDDSFEEFKTKTRTEAALRSEGNRRTGGIKTQAANVGDWDVSSNQC